MLDFQVVRAAVKAFKSFSSASGPSAALLSPFTRFLRHASQQSTPPSPLSWHDPGVAVTLLERRALCAVRHYATHEADPDASAAQRVARAVTEAFVAAQVESFVHTVPSQLPGEEAHVLTDVLLLVRNPPISSFSSFVFSFSFSNKTISVYLVLTLSL